MCTKTPRHSCRAWTLMEMMFGVSILSIGVAGLASMFLFGSRSFAVLNNYAVLDQYNRQAMDRLTYELRQARQVTGYTSNATTRSLTLLNGDNVQVTYTFDAQKQQVRRTANNVSSVLLTNCNLLNFSLYMRPPPPPTNSQFDLYPVVPSGTNWPQLVKVVQLAWKTRIAVSPTARVNSEDIQTACVVIRKQQD